ncbi:hypothetical protein DPX16_21306 [Anabarilius grahami]|uniref:Uncharacterized protein n=1 Tax=Anabarilius grahami TaxID=495550 RepID=A0A3N0XZS1_ANAGA|nr:hypothetical protein DPX16_21306 [Anabarilius grahami]
MRERQRLCAIGCDPCCSAWFYWLSPSPVFSMTMLTRLNTAAIVLQQPGVGRAEHQRGKPEEQRRETRQVPPSTNTSALNSQSINHHHLHIISTAITRTTKDSHTLFVRSRLHFTYLNAYLKDSSDLLTCRQRLLCSSCAIPSVCECSLSPISSVCSVLQPCDHKRTVLPLCLPFFIIHHYSLTCTVV